MVLCFELSPAAKSALDKLLATGQFKDTSEAISVAVMSYEVIQRTVCKSGQMVVNAEGAAKELQPAITSAVRSTGQPGSQPFAVPLIFRYSESDLAGLEFAPTPEATLNLTLSPKDWPFGQYNRFLPPKATCRALLNVMRQNPRGLSVDEASAKISFDACGLGDFLADLDARWHRRREDALASAFPTSAFNGAESRMRYGSQFVGALKQGKLTGFPAALRFVACDSSKDCRLLLTQAGAEFAKLENPILDASEPAQRKFTEAELRFLLEHILRAVPEESSAYAAIIDGIESGANTPEKLDAYLCKRFNLVVVMKADKPNEITQTFLTTQRTGAISRMADLDLVSREKKGLHVTYLATHPGKYFRSQLN